MSDRDEGLRIESLVESGRGGVLARQAGLPVGVRQVHRAVLRAFLANGRAPDRDEVVAPVGVDVAAAFRQLDEVDLVQVDDAGHVAAAYPFSAVPTGHVVRLEGAASVHAMCAIDALGIPLMTGSDGVIESADPDDGEPVRVERCGSKWRWSPAETVVLLGQNTVFGPAAECLCPNIAFHTSRQSAERHLRRHPELIGLVLEQPQAVEVARRSFGALLAEQTTGPSAGCSP